MNLKESLRNDLTEEEIKYLRRSFEIIGSKEKSIAIIEIPDELKSREKVISNAIMNLHKNIKSVLKKNSERKGKLRKRKYELIDGDINTEVIHIESGCKFKLNPKKTYFSPRESTERRRIAEKIKPNERILVPFNGISPLPIIMLKKQPKIKEICGIELNKDAHRYALENIKLNKVSDKIDLILGDVRKICPQLKKKFNQIIMPLPIQGHQFLDVLIPCLKSKGIIHFYYVAPEDDLFTDATKLIKEISMKFNKKIKILSKRKVLLYGPRKWKIVLEVLFL